jgi:glutamine amidotransferase
VKSRKVTIIDYGMGNLISLQNAFNYVNAKVIISNSSKEISQSEIVVLPGVGSYPKAMKIIKKENLDYAIKKVIKRGNFLFCICLGMQLLGSSSTEEKYTKGLEIINNKVEKFKLKEINNKKIPHVGFNKINFDTRNKFFNGIKNGADFYFVHSYRMLQEKLKNNISVTNYGINFLSSFNINNIYATQFHPEKSQANGLKLLDNFIKLT